MTAPTVGRIVHYRLTRDEATRINGRRQHASEHAVEHHNAATGVQVHTGNRHRAGDVLPLLIVRVWENEYTDYSDQGPEYLYPPQQFSFDGGDTWHIPLSPYGVNGQAFTDGNDVLWVTSAPEGDFDGGWMWPPREPAPPVHQCACENVIG